MTLMRCLRAQRRGLPGPRSPFGPQSEDKPRNDRQPSRRAVRLVAKTMRVRPGVECAIATAHRVIDPVVLKYELTVEHVHDVNALMSDGVSELAVGFEAGGNQLKVEAG